MNKEKLIKKWLDNELSEAELQQFKQMEEYEAYSKISQHTEFFKAPDFDSSEAYKILKSRIDDTSKRRNLLIKLKPILQMAAILIVGIAVFKLFFESDLISVRSLAGQSVEIILPDASRVTLNAISELKYSEESWDGSRRVELEGEAFFKVEKGAKFDVETTFGVVRVIGTAFNVKSRDRYFEVSCYEGQVNVLLNNEIIPLPLGNSLRILDGALSKEQTTVLSPTWIAGVSSFKSIPLKQVWAEFERQFGVSVESGFETEDLFTGTFINSDIHLALKSICIPYGLSYEIVNERVIIRKLD